MPFKKKKLAVPCKCLISLTHDQHSDRIPAPIVWYDREESWKFATVAPPALIKQPPGPHLSVYIQLCSFTFCTARLHSASFTFCSARLQHGIVPIVERIANVSPCSAPGCGGAWRRCRHFPHGWNLLNSHFESFWPNRGGWQQCRQWQQ